MVATETACNPTVAHLYFDGKQRNKIQEDSSLTTLPPEILKHCLVDYLDWGDLAKLSTVQSSWKTLLIDAARFGGCKAKWELAEAMLNGKRGLTKNPEQAVTLFREMAGVRLDFHNKKESDKTETESTAVSVERTKEPFSPAMKRIAECYLKGVGVETNRDLGVRWLQVAYEVANDVDAAHTLAVLYEHGKFAVEIDVYRAAEWFLKAAQGGHTEAMAEYGLCCELGCGRDQSDEEALDWYMRAANNGHTTAKYSVGEAFEEARGVPQSDEEACLWYYKAAVEGDVDSKRALRRLHDIARIVVPGVAAILDV